MKIFTDAAVDAVIQKHATPEQRAAAEEEVQHLSQAERAPAGVAKAAEGLVVVNVPLVGDSLVAGKPDVLSEKTERNVFSVKKVAEELLVLAHGTPYQRSLFLKKDYVDEDGRDHFTMHFLCADGRFDDVPTSGAELDEERFNVAIKRAIIAAIERRLARSSNGHEPVARRKKPLVEDMEKSLRSGWMISLLLKMGRLYHAEELERRRERARGEVSSKTPEPPKKPRQTERVGRRRTLGDEVKDEGDKRARNEEVVTLQKVKRAPSVETPPKKHRAAAAQTLTVIEEDEDDDDVIAEDKDDKDYESSKRRRRRRNRRDEKTVTPADEVARYEKELLDYINSDEGISFGELVKQRPELLKSSLEARSFREVGLLYFMLDTGLGISLATQYRGNGKKYNRATSPLALSLYKKKYGLHLLADNITSGDLFGAVQELITSGAVKPFFG